jgi:hypothetical protein
LQSKNIKRDAAISISSGEINLPTDIKFPRSLYLTDTIYGGPIEIVDDPSKIYYLRATRFPIAGVPTYGCIFKETGVAEPKLIVAPTPNVIYTATLIYEPELTTLVDAADTNWALTEHPNVYLYGALKHSAPYLREDPRVELWARLYEDHIAKLAKIRDRFEHGIGPLTARPRRTLG